MAVCLPPPCECVDVGELTRRVGPDVGCAEMLCHVRTPLQQQRAFVVVTPYRVDQRDSEVQQAACCQVLVAGMVGLVSGAPKALQPRIRCAGVERRLT